MPWPWFYDWSTMTPRWVDFRTPIISPGERWFRQLHVRAHVVGGMLWAVLFRFLILATPSGGFVLDFRHSAGLRLAAVGLTQLTLWEMIQRENWRPELMTPPAPALSGYPWLSAIWDVLFTLAGAAALELILWIWGML